VMGPPCPSPPPANFAQQRRRDMPSIFGNLYDPGLGPNEPPRRTLWQRIVAAVRHGWNRWTS
jgi:hypothetical protein